VKFGLIVEGQGDVAALPALVHRSALHLGFRGELRIPTPFRLKRGLMESLDELSRAVELIARQTAPDGPILIVLDADNTPGCQIAPQLLAKACSLRSDRRIGVVAAVREYEAWIVAGQASLASMPGWIGGNELVEDPEALSSPKAWLDHRLENGYSPTIDQIKITRQFDLDQARRSWSFDKFLRELARLLGHPELPIRTTDSE
jgi:hypothetical protein